MNTVEFTIERDYPEKMIAERLGYLLKGHQASFKPFKKSNGNWVLDSGNNWFFHHNPETDMYEITFRYPISESELVALRTVIQMVL